MIFDFGILLEERKKNPDVLKSKLALNYIDKEERKKNLLRTCVCVCVRVCMNVSFRVTLFFEEAS